MLCLSVEDNVHLVRSEVSAEMQPIYALLEELVEMGHLCPGNASIAKQEIELSVGAQFLRQRIAYQISKDHAQDNHIRPMFGDSGPCIYDRDVRILKGMQLIF